MINAGSRGLGGVAGVGVGVLVCRRPGRSGGAPSRCGGARLASAISSAISSRQPRSRKKESAAEKASASISFRNTFMSTSQRPASTATNSPIRPSVYLARRSPAPLRSLRRPPTAGEGQPPGGRSLVSRCGGPASGRPANQSDRVRHGERPPPPTRRRAAAATPRPDRRPAARRTPRRRRRPAPPPPGPRRTPRPGSRRRTARPAGSPPASRWCARSRRRRSRRTPVEQHQREHADDQAGQAHPEQVAQGTTRPSASRRGNPPCCSVRVARSSTARVRGGSGPDLLRLGAALGQRTGPSYSRTTS